MVSFCFVGKHQRLRLNTEALETKFSFFPPANVFRESFRGGWFHRHHARNCAKRNVTWYPSFCCLWTDLINTFTYYTLTVFEQSAVSETFKSLLRNKTLDRMKSSPMFHCNNANQGTMNHFIDDEVSFIYSRSGLTKEFAN